MSIANSRLSDSRSASQETPLIFRNPCVCCCLDEKSQMDLVPGKLNPNHTLPFYLLALSVLLFYIPSCFPIAICIYFQYLLCYHESSSLNRHIYQYLVFEDSEQ
jgi:hypothetical protein